jgi:ribosomal protein S18 acetylase RimI-like enzyme
MKAALRTAQLVEIYEGRTRVACCKLYRTGKNRCIIGSVIVYKRFRGKGYGDALMKAVIGTGFNIMLWVEPTNVIAYNLYIKHGFKKIMTDEDERIIMFRRAKV